jgi:L-threonylcarbamoyladenylate synthase
MDMICRYVKEVPEMAIQLVEVNDKPMTIIYPGAVAGEQGDMKASRHCLAFNAVAADGTVGIRIPMMDFCRELVAKLGRPIVSTSANISGEKTPAKFAEIADEIKTGVDHIVGPSLEKGATGQSSSIIKVGLDYSIEIIRK